MQMIILTVFFGGEWKVEEGNCAYIGDVISKAFMVNDALQFEDLKKMIIDRFKIKSTSSDLVLSHLHPFQQLTSPYVVDTEEDYSLFVSINECSQVSWTLPLYVSSIGLSTALSSNLLTNGEIQNTLTVENNRPQIVDAQEDFPLDFNVHCDNRVSLEIGGEIQNTLTLENNRPQIVDAQENFPLDFNVHCDNRVSLEIGQSSKVNDHALPIGNEFLHVGQIFKTKDDLKTAIKKKAMCENFGYKVYKSSAELYKVLCVDADCKWRIRAAKLKGSEYFEIRKLNDEHSCSFDLRCAKHSKPTYKTVGQHIKTRFIGVKIGPNAGMIRNDMREELYQDVSYWKAWKAQEWAQNLIRGTPEENYAIIPSYCYMLKSVNPGTYTSFETDDENRFKYVFISIGASIRGFTAMRKVIMVDGTFLHGKYEGNLMIATAQDANNQIYPLGYAVVDSENDKSWTWFFQQLHTVIPSSDDLLIISDRHFSIAKAVETVYRSAKHVVCMRHLKSNLKTRFKEKGVLGLFSNAANAYTITEFEQWFNEICAINPEIGEYLTIANFQKWARAHCQGDRYNIMTTNNSESINSVLRDARSFQIVALLDYIRSLLSIWFNKRRELTICHNEELPPHVKQVVEARYKESNRYEAKQLNRVQFEVSGGGFTGVVDLTRRTCSCRVFDLDKIPCSHAMTTIKKVNGRITEFISPYYQFESWKMTYKETIYPVPMKSQWTVPECVSNIVILPPCYTKKAGRPRKRRLPSEGEFKKTIIKKSRMKTVKCGLCGIAGHNKKTCMNRASSNNRATSSNN